MDLFATRSFRFRDTRLAFYEYPGRLPRNRPGSIVFFHATGFSALTYRPLLTELSAQGFDVYALDFSGHGASDPNYDFKDWYFFRDQALAFLDHLGLKSAYGIGHSLGGASLFLAAAADPQNRLQKLVGLDPVVLSPMRSWLLPLHTRLHPLARAAEKRREVMPSRAVLERSFRRSPTFRDWDETSFQGYLDSCFDMQADGSLQLALPRELEARVFRSQNYGHWRWFRRLSQPMLVYIAEKSYVASPGSARLLTRKHKASRLEQHASGSHFFPMIDPFGTAERIVDFFNTGASNGS